MSDNDSFRAGPDENGDGSMVVEVWDWPVRVVHWTMVLLLLTLVVTAKMGGPAMEWHMRAGEVMLAVVVFRVLWGFAGSPRARFVNFLRGPRAVVTYARSLRRRSYKVHLGHNPLGGWMIVLLLGMLLVQAGTGLFSRDDFAAEGPLVRLISDEWSDAISSFHSNNAWVLVGLACVHIVAVLGYLFALKLNLIKPMIVGRQRVPVTFVTATPRRRLSRRALLLAVLSGVVVWRIVTRA
jgi:cytochrome b